MVLHIKKIDRITSNCPAPTVASTSRTSTSNDNSSGTEAVQEVNSPNFHELSETEKPQASVTKKIKQSLDPDYGAELIDEMQQLLSRYIRSKKQGNLQIVQPGPPVSMAWTSQMPTMSQLQRNPEIQYDNNNSYYNM